MSMSTGKLPILIKEKSGAMVAMCGGQSITESRDTQITYKRVYTNTVPAVLPQAERMCCKLGASFDSRQGHTGSGVHLASYSMRKRVSPPPPDVEIAISKRRKTIDPVTLLVIKLLTSRELSRTVRNTRQKLCFDG